MKSRTIAIAIAHAAAVFTLLTNVSVALAAFRTSTHVNVDYHPDRVDKPFDFYLSSNTLGIDAQYLAPDGTELGNRGVISGLSAAELTARFTGSWTITAESLPFPPKIEQHIFAIDDFKLDNLAVAPSILSPLDGARLPAKFNLNHTGRFYVLQGTYFRIGMASSQVDLSGHTSVLPATVTAWSTSSEYLVMGNATPGSTNPFWNFSIQVNKNTYSVPSTWTVGVPEPASLTLTGLAFLSLVALRRRK